MLATRIERQTFSAIPININSGNPCVVYGAIISTEDATGSVDIVLEDANLRDGSRNQILEVNDAIPADGWFLWEPHPFIADRGLRLASYSGSSTNLKATIFYSTE